MGSAALRISRILENLRLIQNDVTSLAEEETNAGPDSLEEPDLQALHTVRLSLDHLRQVLQAYIDFATSEKELPDVEEFYSLRAERTLQILRYACIGLQLREGRSLDARNSIFEELTQMAFAAVDRAYLQGAPPGKIHPSAEVTLLYPSVAVAS